MKKRIVKLALLAAACLLVGFAAFAAVGRVQRGRIYSELQKTAPYTGEKDFAFLRQLNPDIFAWISIEGTEISYPIVKHPTDDGWYLTHTVEGLRGYPGSIFTYGYTAEDFSQFNTIIYGHDLTFGGMFSDLNLFLDREYLQAHPTLRISTPTENHSYTVTTCVGYDDRLIDTCFDQRDPEDRKRFLQSVLAAGGDGTERIDVLRDHILTLETCRGGSGKRTIVIAVRND